MLQLFITVPRVVLTHNLQIILLQLHSCNLAKVMDCNVNTFGDGGLLKGSWLTGQELLFRLTPVHYIADTL